MADEFAAAGARLRAVGAGKLLPYGATDLCHREEPQSGDVAILSILAGLPRFPR